MLGDSELLVRRNAALSLVRFGDASGLSELRAMLQPYTVKATVAGDVSYTQSEGDWVERGDVVIVLTGESRLVELSAPVPGYAGAALVPEGSPVTQDQSLMGLSPDPSHVWEALRALYLVGGGPELRLVTAIAQNPGFAEQIHQQAVLTAQAIQKRLSGKSE